jgi:CCR4-NOT transcription complex subunit 4
MNGLCPACRRQYNDNDIEYKVITPEEAAAHKARQAHKQKKTQQALQKEKQKAEADNLSRKHLAGLRVMQKNLVYVTGLTPNLQEDKLLQILRSDQYFGRYGEIIKIVVSKAKDTAHPQSVGVYVTYKRKEDAAQCIAAVDGSKNGDRTLRAQFGTTKYCSAYLRGENCPNRNCMFLHEPGEANESYSRAALSSFNAGQHGPERSAPPQSQMPVASASQTIIEKIGRRLSDERTQSPSTDRPALPSTASWASKIPQHIPSRTESRSTSGVVESPVPVNATPAPSQPTQSPAQERAQPEPDQTQSDAPAQPAPKPQRPQKPRELSPLSLLLKNFNLDDLKFSFSIASLPASDVEVIANYPPLFDRDGGAKRRLRRQREEEQRRMEQEAQELQQHASVDSDENAELSGSLQLGGEPEERQIRSQPQSAIQPPGHDGFPGLDQRFHLGPTSPGISDRNLTPQQQQQRQQMFLQEMKGLSNQGSYLNNPNQSSFGQPPAHPPGHQRNASRYSFANESSASTSVKPVANPKLLSQQSSIMPPTGNTHFGAQHQQPHGSQFYTSNVQGPPPGLRTSGTPPVSGGMTFGQGHGFATGGIQYSAGAGRNSNEEMMRNLLVQRRDASGATGADQAKREYSSYSTNSAFAGSQTGAFPAAGSLAASGAFPTGPPSNYSLSSFSGEEKRGKKKTKRHKHNNASSSSGGTNLNLGDVDPMGTAARFGSAGGAGYGQAGGLYTGGMHGGGGYRGGW